MRFRACFLLCMWIFPLYLWSFPIEKFHVCTVANTTDWPSFFFLQHSTQRSGIDLEVIGLGRPYFGNGTKFLYMREYLDGLEDDEIVLFLDAFDTMIIQSKEELLNKFLSFETPFVISAEKYCAIPSLGSEFEPTGLYPYLNSGGYVGYVGNLKRWIDELEIDVTQFDQPQVIHHYIKNKSSYVIDTECRIFYSFHKGKASEFSISNQGRVYVKSTGQYPGIIHASGKTFYFLIPVYKAFMQKLRLD